MNNEINLNAHTIIFTEDCPLDCRYCHLKTDDGYHMFPSLTYETILNKIEQFVAEDKEKGFKTQITFSGGEPFLYWDWIDKIIDIYGNDLAYHFNTSGYCFTEEMLEKLSKQQTYFTLSVDGGEKITNYLRPVLGNKYKVGYFQKLKQIAPTLLYYFPTVTAKIIVNNRTADLLYETYLDLEAIGFKKVSFILDFNARPSVKGTKKEIQRLWEDSDTLVLEEQLNLLLEELILRCSFNKDFMKIENMDKIIKFLLKKIDTYSPRNLECKVFNGRTLTSIAQNYNISCLQEYFSSLEEAENALIEGFNTLNNQCPLDKDCEAFLFCANTHCPAASLAATNTLFGFDTLECVLDKVFYKFCLQFLEINNEINSDKIIYSQYINQFDYIGKEEYLNDILSF